MALYQGSFSVFSTYVEVILLDTTGRSAGFGVLHVCGGDPNKQGNNKNKLQCSPRMWR